MVHRLGKMEPAVDLHVLFTGELKQKFEKKYHNPRYCRALHWHSWFSEGRLIIMITAADILTLKL